jgi:DNA-nicking Smr family endonuclease
MALTDFGSILDAWEGNKREGTGRANKNKKEFTDWLDTHRVYDKDASLEDAAASGGREGAAERRHRLKAKAPDARLDLHGKTSDEALLSLERFFEDAQRRGWEKVLIIHGKGLHSSKLDRGRNTLAHTVQAFLDACPSAGERGRPPEREGGQGAVWVLIKRQS